MANTAIASTYASFLQLLHSQVTQLSHAMIARKFQKYNVNAINADSMCITRCEIAMQIESVNMPLANQVHSVHNQ